MKKNLISVIILALCVVNLILNALIVFVCVPSNKKVNKLVTEIASVLNLELTGSDVPQVDVKNIATFTSSEDMTVALKYDGSTNADGSKKDHYAVVSITISMDKSSKEYDSINTLITESEGLVNDVVMNVISQYTKDDLDSQDTKTTIKQQILEQLRTKFGSECIYSVDFKNLLVS